MRRLSASNRAFASRFFVPVVLVLAALATAVVAYLALRPFEPVRAEVVQDGLEHPWDIAFAADGRMLVTERAGRVLVFDSGEPHAELLYTAVVPDVRAELESGLMGIAVRGTTVFVCASRDPDDAPWRVELLRSTLGDDDTLTPFETVPLGGEAVGAPRHQGCAVELGFGHLWVTIGDANLPAGENRAQDPTALNGKTLRLGPDGSIEGDGPFSSAVFSVGHRNPQGIVFASPDQILVAEHGTDINDEINVIHSGGNYGYPCFTGASDVGPIPDACGPASDYLAPAWASGSPTLATSGIAVLSGSIWAGWEGRIVVSTLKEEDLRVFSLASDGTLTARETWLDGRFGRLRAVVIGPDGTLYVSTANGPGDRVIRVSR
jgi:glucose/arabinose dehydrogenase